MAFVNEYISSEDRVRYQLEAFEKRLPSSNPQDTWAIDREREIFLRVVRPGARKSEPGDPDARFEKDFQFHWKGYDFMVATRMAATQEFLDWPGDVFLSSKVPASDALILRFYLRHIGETGKPSSDAPSALIHQRQEVLSDLEEALGIGYGGVFARLTPEEAARPRQAAIKVAPGAEVAA